MSGKPGDEVVLGKKFPGEKFCTVKSMADHEEDQALFEKYGKHAEAMPLTVYFSQKRINDPVQQAMMLSYTKVRHATMAVFDEIFAKF